MLIVISSFFNDYVGEIAALTAAFLWAASSLVYSSVGRTIPPLQLNIIKGSVAIALLIITLILVDGLTFGNLNLATAGLLLLSGAIGIGLGDTAYFLALNSLGARRTLLLETLAPAIATVIAFVALQEKLSIQAIIGILITILGVAWVISERTASVGDRPAIHPSQGLFWGIGAAVAQATGAVLSRSALTQLADTDWSNAQQTLISTLLRLLAGVTTAVILFLFRPRGSSVKSITWSFKLVTIIIITAIGSTYLGIWLQQISLRFAPVGIAQTLTATSPIFILPLVVIMGEKVSIRAVLGALIALYGIALLFEVS